MSVSNEEVFACHNHSFINVLLQLNIKKKNVPTQWIFSAKIFDLAVQDPVCVTMVFLNVFMVVCRLLQNLVKVREILFGPKCYCCLNSTAHRTQESNSGLQCVSPLLFI